MLTSNLFDCLNSSHYNETYFTLAHRRHDPVETWYYRFHHTGPWTERLCILDMTELFEGSPIKTV